MVGVGVGGVGGVLGGEALISSVACTSAEAKQREGNGRGDNNNGEC